MGSSSDYAYDANGNMTEDLNKGISNISYNYLNLPVLITFSNGNRVEYTYDGSGMKLDKLTVENSVMTTTDYVGPMVYEGAGDVFLNTEEGRVVLEEGGTAKEEYQYTLKDHLGNVRVTFSTATSQQMSSTYLATMEPQVSSLWESMPLAEDSTFNNLETTRQTDKIYNHTPGGNSSARLNAAEGKTMGPSMGLHSLSRTCSGMMPGDTVKMEVFAKYDQPAKSKDAISGMASMVAAAFTGGAATEAPILANAVNEALGIGQVALFSKDNSLPKAYLNYLFFDKNMKYKSGGFRQVSRDAKGSFEALDLDYVPQEEGYMMVYTANQTNENLNVYFDDMAVTHTSGPIIRTDDYYPFGMTFNTGVLDGALANRYLYNGKEKQELTGWYDYGARMYDAEIGRWHVIDLLADSAYSLTPYRYAQNNPIKIHDPDGLDDFYDVNGNFVYHIQNKTDNIMVVNNKGMDYASLVDKGSAAYGRVLSDYSSGIDVSGISGEYASKIFTNILDKNGFDISKLDNGQVAIDGGYNSSENFNNGDNLLKDENASGFKVGQINPSTGKEYTYTGKAKKGTIHVTARYDSKKGTYDLSTVSNVVSILGIHEYIGHAVLGLSGTKFDHKKIYNMQKKDPTYKKLTPDYRQKINEHLQSYR